MATNYPNIRYKVMPGREHVCGTYEKLLQYTGSYEGLYIERDIDSYDYKIVSEQGSVLDYCSCFSPSDLVSVPQSLSVELTSELTVKSNNLLTRTMESVREKLKSKKQKLYEKYILNIEGELNLSNPIVQDKIFEVLEENGLEKVVREHDKEVKKRNKA